MPNQEGLQRNYAERTGAAREKAMKAIQELKNQGMQINFSTVAKQSKVSRHFLYDDSQTRQAIEEHRKCDVSNEMNKRAKYDKTSKSKDVIIKAKDKRIAKLEDENRRLKAELVTLRGLIYAEKLK